MAKYIDAERLKAEIEFAKSVYDSPNRVVSGVADAFRQDGRVAMCDDILKTIDSLQQEQPCDTCTNDKGCVTCKDGELWEGKEQPCGGYDEAYLNEKIAKASKTWEGVDVDKYMAEMRGYEQPSEDLEEEIKRYEANLPESATVDPFEDYPTLKDVARHFVNWQKEQMIRDCSVQASYEAEIEKAEERGYNLCKKQMLKDAVKGTVCKDKECVWIELIPNALPDYEDIESVKCVVIKED